MPTRDGVVEVPPLPFPLHALRVPPGAVISLTSRQGLGKSGIACSLHQPLSEELIPAMREARRRRTIGPISRIGGYLATEQSPGEIRGIARRVGMAEDDKFRIWHIDQANQWRDFEVGLAGLTAPVGYWAVIDSLTEMGTKAVDALNAFRVNCAKSGRRGICVNQTNKLGQVGGSIKALFLVDIVADLETDAYGRRIFIVGKNRHGPSSLVYIKYTSEGGFIPGSADFNTILHTIEGVDPSYSIVPVGMATGAIPGKLGQARGGNFQWAGLAEAMVAWGIARKYKGYACAAAETPATDSGFIEPPDWERRRRVCLDNGMKGYLRPADVLPDLERAGWVHSEVALREDLRIKILSRAKRLTALEEES